MIVLADWMMASARFFRALVVYSCHVCSLKEPTSSSNQPTGATVFPVRRINQPVESVEPFSGGAMFANLRFSLRILRKHAKLATIAILSLAIGMAAASIGLSTFNALLVQSPAVPEPNRLLTIYTVTPDAPFNQLSYPDYLYYRDNNQA